MDLSDDNRPRGRFGVYTGIVHDNRDPEKAGRLRLVIPSIMGTDPFAPWALMGGQHLGVSPQPSGYGHGPRSLGSFRVPAVGSQVLVMFLDGDVHAPVWFPGVWPRNLVPPAAQTGSYPERPVLARGEKLEVVEDRDGHLAVRAGPDRGSMDVEIDTRGGDLTVRTDPDGRIKLQGGDENQRAARIIDPVVCGTLTGVFSPGTGALMGLVYTAPDGTTVTLSATPPGVPSVTLSGQITGGAPLVLIGG